MFLTELHAHTSEVSPCSHQTAEQVADRYLEAGYSTVVVTNHLFEKTWAKQPPMTWDEKVDFYLSGYKKMKDYAGDRMNILLGCELRFTEAINDYLIVGITEEFLRSHPFLFRVTLKEFAPYAREAGFLIVQAHPFRNGITIKDPNDLDGIEIFNGHRKQESRNDIALAWCRRFGKIPTSGSDFHDEDHETAGGILTNDPITSNEELLAVLKSGNYTLRCSGTAAARDGLCDMSAAEAVPNRK